MTFVDITLGRATKPREVAPVQAARPDAAKEAPKQARAPHLLHSAWDGFKKELAQGKIVDARKGLARAYRKHLRQMGMMDGNELSLLPGETDDLVFIAIQDTMNRFPEESSFFVFQSLLKNEGTPTPWGESQPAPLQDYTGTRNWLLAQEVAIEKHLEQQGEPEIRLWMVSRQREFREIRERLEDLIEEELRD